MQHMRELLGQQLLDVYKRAAKGCASMGSNRSDGVRARVRRRIFAKVLRAQAGRAQSTGRPARRHQVGRAVRRGRVGQVHRPGIPILRTQAWRRRWKKRC
jgi:hypothetical protein